VGAETIEPEPLVCAECGRQPREDENAEDEWRTFYEGVGDGVTLCPECASRVVRDVELPE
jgi:hypothetical protein